MCFYYCQLPSYDLFTSHSSFIIFWERDITSEHHGTPVHILITVYTLNLFPAFTFQSQLSLSLSLVFDPLETTRSERLTTSLNFVGSKVICICVQVHVNY